MDATKLADALQVSKQSISYWETGRKAPKMKKIEEMAKLFDVSVSYILDGKLNKLITLLQKRLPHI